MSCRFATHLHLRPRDNYCALILCQYEYAYGPVRYGKSAPPPRKHGSSLRYGTGTFPASILSRLFRTLSESG